MSTMALPPGASTGEDWSDPDENGVCHRAVDWANHWSGDTVAGVTGLQYTTGQITPFISCAFTGRDGNERVIEISAEVAQQIVGVLSSCLADWPEPR